MDGIGKTSRRLTVIWRKYHEDIRLDYSVNQAAHRNEEPLKLSIFYKFQEMLPGAQGDYERLCSEGLTYGNISE